MRLIGPTSVLVIALVALAACSSSPSSKSTAPVTLASEQVTLEGSITRVDRTQRMVTIRGADGGEVDFFAGEQVRNFERLQVGDRVALDYTTAVALEIQPAGSAEVGATVEQGRSVPAAGARPGGAVSETVTVVAEVVAVDAAANTVTVRGPRGNVVTLDVVREDLRAGLRRLKAGDLLRVTFSEAVAVDIRPRPQ
ncbi:hypothetical protein MNQ95_08925 [Pseudoxanthomonas daejeonensis]|uniref:hypothetical protein n=1 Tax=Pseudoxanthomonas daejeonensis TaxID=266062 RepID=UPI001F546752|nr:hypothetical protein [Pseudoxanthomonas daejeonensis]UNK56298.1 hypothetical protein MNQ95_08925 [Pseudoxanthomonas daejeonensis]